MECMELPRVDYLAEMMERKGQPVGRKPGGFDPVVPAVMPKPPGERHLGLHYGL